MRVLVPVAALGAAVLLLGCSPSGEQDSAQPTRSVTPTAGPTPSASPTSSTSPTQVAAPSGTAAPAHLALGDSVAAGIGAQVPSQGGYVAVLAELLCGRDGAAATCPAPVRNLAVPGATTASLLRDQLPVALELLRSGQDVRAVTVTVGGNDVFVPVLRACSQAPEAPSCAEAVRAAVGEVDAGVDRLLADLAAASGPGTTVAVMTYYDPLAACRLSPLQPLAERVLEGTAGEDGLNDVLRARAGEHGAVVAETSGLLTAPQDFVGGLDCLHPSGTGHARIAEAFARVIAG